MSLTSAEAKKESRLEAEAEAEASQTRPDNYRRRLAVAILWLVWQ